MSKGIYLWGCQFEADQPFASSYIQTVASTVTRNTDSLSFPFSSTPQESTFYCKFIEAGTILSGGDTRVFTVSNSAGDNPALALRVVGGKYDIFHSNGVASDSATAAAAPSIDDTVELRAVLGADGSVALGQSINGAAEVVTAASGAVSFAAAWADQLFWLNSVGATTVGFNKFMSARVAKGTKTLAQMQALTAGDADTLLYYNPYDSKLVTAFPAAYPASTTLYGEERGGDSLSAADLTNLERIDYTKILTAHTNARYWSTEFSDTGNSAGYVQFGRLWISPGYEPSHNFSVGAEIGQSTSSKSIETEGGGFIHEKRPRRRVVNISLDDLPEDEALVQVFELVRAVGTTEQILFAWNQDDTTHTWRRTFVGTLQDIDLLKYPKFGTYADQAFSVVEEL